MVFDQHCEGVVSLLPQISRSIWLIMAPSSTDYRRMAVILSKMTKHNSNCQGDQHLKKTETKVESQGTKQVQITHK